MNNLKEKNYKSENLARDPVCGMMVDKEKALKKKIGDRVYYFCSKKCRKSFEENPQKFKVTN